MAPFRPTNVNKRSYPGNANVLGPTVSTTLGISTTTCCSSTPSCAACCCQPLCLGCRCSFCGCPYCEFCCSCDCTVCTPNVPAGVWSSSEQYEASTRDAWGSDAISSAGPATCLCCVNVGFACTSNIVDCKGFFICCGPSTEKWFVSPACTEVSRSWGSQVDAVTVANSCMGACGWFIPQLAKMSDPGYACRVYWDSYSLASYSVNDAINGAHPYFLNMSSGGSFYVLYGGGTVACARAFRCTAT